MGAVQEADGETGLKQLADDYLSLTAEKKKNGELKTAIVVSPTHAQAEKVTDFIRQGLKKAGKITGKEGIYTSLRSLNFTEPEKRDFANYEPGMVVRFQQHRNGFKRGTTAVVESAEPGRVQMKTPSGEVRTLLLKDVDRFEVYFAREIALAKGDKVRITINGETRETRRGAVSAKSELTNGQLLEVKKLLPGGDIQMTNGFVVPKDHGGLTHGLVVTSHASQVKTMDYAFIAMNSESLLAASREQFYVSVSRGREGVRLYTDDKDEMVRAVKASSARMSTSDLLGSPPREKKQPLMHRLIGMQRVRNAYQVVRESGASSAAPT